MSFTKGAGGDFPEPGKQQAPRCDRHIVGHRRKLLDAIAALRASTLPAPGDARDATVQSPSTVDPIGERQ